MLARRTRRAIGQVGLLVGVGLVVCGAAGQDVRKLAELRRWHDRLTAPFEVATVETGREALEKLATWNLSLGNLSEDERRWALRLEVHAALAVGDAQRAANVLPDLMGEYGGQRDTLRTQWLVACATGDAEFAKRTLVALRKAGLARKSAVAKRVRRMKMLGHAAPNQDVRADDGKIYALRERDGVVLVVDFWHQREAPEERQREALTQLHETYQDDPNVAFLGINSDPPTNLDAAKRFAGEHGYRWSQLCERTDRGAMLTEKLFAVEEMPWTVIIDQYGNVRAIGAAYEPCLQYALRAAAAEARGAQGVVIPKTTEGEKAPLPKAESPQKDDEDGAEFVPKGELPRNAEAAKLLDQARLYLKTGRKRDAKALLQEIINKYPGTWEAREAQERLQSL